MVTDILEVKLSVKIRVIETLRFFLLLVMKSVSVGEKILYFFIILVVSFCIVIADTLPTPFYI